MVKRIENKKGSSTIFILVGIALILVVIFSIIFIGIFSGHVNSIFDYNISVGQVNLKTVNSQTFGVFDNMLARNADFWGMSAIFGMILGLFLSAYLGRNTSPKVVLIFDIFILIGSFIFSLYLRGVYSSLVTALNSAGESFAMDHLNATSGFILNLPIYITIIGVVMIILLYSGIPRKREETRGIGGIVAG